MREHKDGGSICDGGREGGSWNGYVRQCAWEALSKGNGCRQRRVNAGCMAFMSFCGAGMLGGAGDASHVSVAPALIPPLLCWCIAAGALAETDCSPGGGALDLEPAGHGE